MILITGAAGKTGTEVARQLAAAHIPFRALVRNPAKAELLRKTAAEVAVGDLADRAFLRSVLRGVDKALLVMPNDQHQETLEKQFTDCAVEARVAHLVKLSSLESVPGTTNPITRMHVASEEHIRESGLAWTMIRPTFFMQTFVGSAPRIRERNEIAMPAGAGTIAPTDLRDVAAVITLVLTSAGHGHRSYDLTGPELLTLPQVAACFSRVLGREIRYADQPMEEFRERLRSIKLSEWRVQAVSREFEAISAGVIDHTTGTIEQLLGRPAAALEQFVGEYRELFTPAQA